jgi:hypothetical protein
MEVGQGPNWGCSAKEKKTNLYNKSDISYLTAFMQFSIASMGR